TKPEGLETPSAPAGALCAMQAAGDVAQCQASAGYPLRSTHEIAFPQHWLLPCGPAVALKPSSAQVPAIAQRYASGFGPSRATAPPLGLFLVACGEAAEPVCANAGTSRSPAGYPNKKGNRNGTKEDQRQTERETDL